MRWASLSYRECFWALSMGGCFRDSMDGQFVRYRMDARMLVLDLVVHYAGCDRELRTRSCCCIIVELVRVARFIICGCSPCGVLQCSASKRHAVPEA